MITNNDFRVFQEEVTWFLKPASNVQCIESDIRLSSEFNEIFPKLTSLIEKARVTLVTIDELDYLLFAWDNKKNVVCGLLNIIEEAESYFYELIPEHELLIRIIGGIREAFNQPNDSFSNNQKFHIFGCRMLKRNW